MGRWINLDSLRNRLNSMHTYTHTFDSCNYGCLVSSKSLGDLGKNCVGKGSLLLNLEKTYIIDKVQRPSAGQFPLPQGMSTFCFIQVFTQLDKAQPHKGDKLFCLKSTNLSANLTQHQSHRNIQNNISNI
jgi:hypothetical protein